MVAADARLKHQFRIIKYCFCLNLEYKKYAKNEVDENTIIRLTAENKMLCAYVAYHHKDYPWKNTIN